MFFDFVTKYAYHGVIINGAYFRNALLAQHLLPVIKKLTPEDCFIFQQDSVPAHRAR